MKTAWVWKEKAGRSKNKIKRRMKNETEKKRNEGDAVNRK